VRKRGKFLEELTNYIPREGCLHHLIHQLINYCLVNRFIYSTILFCVHFKLNDMINCLVGVDNFVFVY
jgi:hypothetical protein